MNNFDFHLRVQAARLNFCRMADTLSYPDKNIQRY